LREDSRSAYFLREDSRSAYWLEREDSQDILFRKAVNAHYNLRNGDIKFDSQSRSGN